MSQPPPTDEKLLHERVLRKDPVVSTEVFKTYVDQIVDVLTKHLGCDEDDANQCAVDVVFSYLTNPKRYDPGKGRLGAYLTQAAKYRALDKRRAADARERRNQKYGSDVERRATSPKEVVENSVEAKRIMERLEKRQVLKSERDRKAVRRILMGEGSTKRLAEELELGPLPRDELKREVKRHRDRLMKLLERFGQSLERGGKEESDDES
ncbi:MAG TPA: sigma factor [Archangium sp.]|uniref:RNA polymerase sigma factor n=1 Tax=Archangium sp. TaxID=1872627 RepID=UPI002E34F20B|nr:sigma factor [Archangium sp.]HEX5754527.1 sigma factor [Archangium sp.]